MTRSWEDKNSGKKVYRSEVVVFDITLLTPQENGSSNDGNGRSEKKETNGRGRSLEAAVPDYAELGITESDIPF